MAAPQPDTNSCRLADRRALLMWPPVLMPAAAARKAMLVARSHFGASAVKVAAATVLAGLRTTYHCDASPSMLFVEMGTMLQLLAEKPWHYRPSCTPKCLNLALRCLGLYRLHSPSYRTTLQYMLFHSRKQIVPLEKANLWLGT